MSRGDEVRTTAHNVLHAALRLNRVRDKDCSARPSHPIVRRPRVDLEEKHEPRAALTAEASTGNTAISPRRDEDANDSPNDCRSACLIAVKSCACGAPLRGFATQERGERVLCG